MTGIESLAYLAVRVFTSTSWIGAGVHHATHFGKTAKGVADHGIPLPRLVLPMVIVMELGGSALLLADQYAWAVCLVWIAFLFVATCFYHLQWFTPEGEFDFMQYTQVWKNASMVGGLIAVILLDPSRPGWLLRG